MSDLLLETFWEKVQVNNTTKCWNWIGGKNSDGYGQFRNKNKMIRSHRFAYEVNKGAIPKGLTLDHLCRNRSCVNPGHMEPVTLKENILRGFCPPAINAKKTHCINGHELFGYNLYLDPRGKRNCKKCINNSSKKYRTRKENTFV